MDKRMLSYPEWNSQQHLLVIKISLSLSRK